MAKNTKKTSSKAAKQTVIPAMETDSKCPIWIFTDIDKGGPYAFDVNRENFDHYEVLDKIIHYSTMSWSEIKRQTHDNQKSKHHFLSIESLSKDAQTRLTAKHLEEHSDSIFSFAFQNKLRIIGFRSNQEFHVLWYDPEHEVCPSHKKHT